MAPLVSWFEVLWSASEVGRRWPEKTRLFGIGGLDGQCDPLGCPWLRFGALLRGCCAFGGRCWVRLGQTWLVGQPALCCWPDGVGRDTRGAYAAPYGVCWCGPCGVHWQRVAPPTQDHAFAHGGVGGSRQGGVVGRMPWLQAHTFRCALDSTSWWCVLCNGRGGGGGEKDSGDGGTHLFVLCLCCELGCSKAKAQTVWSGKWDHGADVPLPLPARFARSNACFSPARCRCVPRSVRLGRTP
jgi:hypothetical protein